MVKTVEPCEENVLATLLFNPWIIVTTAITAATPTTIPISVSAVRSLFVRRLATATRNASQTAVRRMREFERVRKNAGLTRPSVFSGGPPS